jgi:hypothetical protein
MAWRLAKALETMRSYFLSLPQPLDLTASMVRTICPGARKSPRRKRLGLACADTRTWFVSAQERPLPPLLLPCAGEALNPARGLLWASRAASALVKTSPVFRPQRPGADPRSFKIAIRTEAFFDVGAQEIGGRHAPPGRLNN